MKINHNGRTLMKVESGLLKLDSSTWETYIDLDDDSIFERCVETGIVVSIDDLCDECCA